MKSDLIIINNSKISGVGVFARKVINKNQVIESCPVIYLSQKDRKVVDSTKLYSYYFGWQDGAAIALGYGSLYNHSYNPNAMYVKEYKTNTITITALKDINKGDEIVVNYNGDPKNKKKLWFIPTS